METVEPQLDKRWRHLRTVPRLIPSSRATSVLFLPVAATKTMRQRKARDCALLGRRAHRSSVARSSSDNSKGSRNGPEIAPSIVADNGTNALNYTEIPKWLRVIDSGH